MKDDVPDDRERVMERMSALKLTGLPVELLLLFTLLIWALYFLIFYSSPKNKVNQWCCIGGFLLSIGVLKEYIYYSGMFAGRDVLLFGVHYELDMLLNSIFTAVLYYVAMPCVLIFSFHFCRLEQIWPRGIKVLEVLAFFPVLCFGVVYPWSQTREIPVTNPKAYTIVACYNLIYGVIATVLIVGTLIRERREIQFRQRRLVSVIALLPLWYWLITLFCFHLLGLEGLDKVWQGNAFILLFLFIYYVRHLFKSGVWGMRLSREHFDWSGESSDISVNERYLIHMLKGETAKIGWCSRSIRELGVPEAEDELTIIDHSVRHIEEFVQRSSQYSGEIVVKWEDVDVSGLFQEIREEMEAQWNGEVRLVMEEPEKRLYCDYYYMKEVLLNLTSNAIDAMGETGVLTLAYSMPQKNIALLRVSDTGCGIAEEEIPKIFTLYYSKKKDVRHFGMGLSYCQKVVRAHGGYIQVESSTGETDHGTEFTICLPAGNRRKKRHGNKQGRDSGADR